MPEARYMFIFRGGVTHQVTLGPSRPRRQGTAMEVIGHADIALWLAARFSLAEDGLLFCAKSLQHTPAQKKLATRGRLQLCRS